MVASRVPKILVVDDEENARLGLSRLLAQEGYDVVCAADGDEALKCLSHVPVNLVISDVQMPGMNGMTFLRELSQRHPGTAVIMITAFGEVESYLEAMHLGAFEYLNKPIKVEELKAVMRKIAGFDQSFMYGYADLPDHTNSEVI
ncbi:MAG: two-component system response regulator [Desulfuromonadales bacterium GWD2_61_12]|nr:MAG: two-component system response regulator [Desulfuromonadales bacterium GWC2_61_20]OGR35071.1 MAG: two-component system response regulator [Desulfuromonadales bacterium GWD2_61_12]